MTTDIEKINDIAWKNVASCIHSLGEIILSPESFYRDARTNKLGYADSTISLIHDLEVENISIDPLLLDGKELLNFFYNTVNTSKYDDAKALINGTSLLRIVRYTGHTSKISISQDDTIPILKDFLIKEFKK
jgi:hypothetical protein